MRHARAMSLLETMLASALLAMVAGTVFGALHFMTSRQRAEQQTLGAHEVANRLVLQYLDDSTRMPDADSGIDYGDDRYHWKLSESPVKIRPVEAANTGAAPETTDNARRTSQFDRVKQITVQAWLSEDSGGSATPGPGTPSATITRIVYPLAYRNPDAFERMTASDAGLRRLFEEIGGGGPGGPGGRGRFGPDGRAGRDGEGGPRPPRAGPDGQPIRIPLDGRPGEFRRGPGGQLEGRPGVDFFIQAPQSRPQNNQPNQNPGSNGRQRRPARPGGGG